MDSKVYVYSWGDGKRIVQFFKVIKETEKMVTLREVEKQKVKDIGSGPNLIKYTVKPIDRFVKSPHGITDRGKIFRKKFDKKTGDIVLENGTASLWDGKPVETIVTFS